MRRSTRLKSSLVGSGFEQKLGPALRAQCGACLLEVDTAGEDGEFMAVLDCCHPRHKFHVGCIFMWAEQENSCPLCKKRFSTVAVYGAGGELLRVSHAEEKDQDFDAAAAERARQEEEEECNCRVCGRNDHEEALLLCDGKGGRCNAAYHYYCVGLVAVPDEDWFCPPCSQSRRTLAAALDLEDSDDELREDGLADFEEAVSSGQGAGGLGDSQAVSSDPGKPRRLRPVTSQDGDGDGEEEVKQELSQDGPSSARGAALDEGERSPSRRKSGPLKKEARASSAALAAALKSSPEGVKDEKPTPKRGRPRRVDPVPPSPSSAGSTPAQARQQRVSHATKSPKPEVTLKEEPPASGTFAGLCSEMPKWISRQGYVVRVDLGGRRLRDPAAAVVAKVVGACLERVRKADATGNLTVSVHLASNRLQGVAGVSAVLRSVTSAGLRVSRLDLEWNKLAWDAAVWLARWCFSQPGGPPDELYLSHNKLGDKALSGLLRVVGSRRNAAPSAGQAPTLGQVPLWIEARENRIRDVDALLNDVSRSVRLCLALDRDVCGPTGCVSCNGTPSAAEMPQIHLPGIFDQDSGKATDGGEKPSAPRTWRGDVRAAKPPLKIKFEEDGDAPGARPISGHPSAAAPREDATPPAADEAAAEGALPAGGHGRGRGAGQKGRRGGRGGAPVAEGDAQDSGEAPQHPQVVEAIERKNWAQSLGTVRTASDAGVGFPDHAPPSFGMWDMVAQQRKRRLLAAREEKKRRRLAEQQASAPSAGTATAPSPAHFADRAVSQPNAQPPPPPPVFATPGAATAVAFAGYPPPHQVFVATQHRVPSVAHGGPHTAPDEELVAPGVPHTSTAPGAFPAHQLTAFESSHVPTLSPMTVVQRMDAAKEAAVALPEPGLADDKLGALIEDCLLRERGLWSSETQYIRNLRRRCMRDQLVREAKHKYAQIAEQAAGSFEAYLRTSSGKQRLTKWVEKRAKEAMEKRSGARG